nr:MAG TPA: hypothetical protein [Caudoviricetes sp.]
MQLYMEPPPRGSFLMPKSEFLAPYFSIIIGIVKKIKKAR